jgi:hypothetical protein
MNRCASNRDVEQAMFVSSAFDRCQPFGATAMATTLSKKPAPATTQPSNVNLSEAIEQCIDRRAGEQVRCTRVYGDKYRCNWVRGGEVGVAGRILKSRFLRVTWNEGSLAIQDITG